MTKIFIKDGIKLALSDSKADSNEIKWLKSVAEINGIDTSWIDTEIEQHANIDFDIELEKYLQVTGYLH